MPPRTSYEKGVCLSVSLVCQTRGLWQNGRKICPDFKPYQWALSLVFWEEEWLVGATLSTWNFGSSWPRWSEIVDIQSIFARSASAVAPSKKVQFTLIGSRRRFSMSLRWTSYVAPKPPPKGAQKRKTAIF